MSNRIKGTIGKGLLAGLAATLVLSMLMVMKAAMGVMPELDLPAMLARMMGAPGMPAVGWAVHFMIGIVGYGLLIAKWPYGVSSSAIVNGIVIGVVGWLIMMLVLMPMTGAGLFALSLGLMAPVMTLVLHLIFGAVLGWTYGKLVEGPTARAGHHHRPGHPSQV